MLCFLVLCFWTAAIGQDAGSKTVTVSGCVMGINGSFKLNAHDGESFILKGDHSTLFSYNGTFVEVTGTVKSKKGSQTAIRTIHVQKLKKLADSCQ
jgi:hypothetical protein